MINNENPTDVSFIKKNNKIINVGPPVIPEIVFEL